MLYSDQQAVFIHASNQAGHKVIFRVRITEGEGCTRVETHALLINAGH